MTEQGSTPPSATAVAAQPSIMRAALLGLCPQCGARTLFAGTARFAPSCRACCLDFTAYNVGDGPAAFLVLIIGALVVGGAVTLQLAAHPPFWVQIILWVPFTVIMVLLGLRVAKAGLIAAEHQRAAREGRLS
jgi:uncharacterized protein (DUF983 family)